MIDLSDTRTVISEKEVSTMTNTIFDSVGLKGKTGMDLKTFQRIFLAKSTAPALQNGSIPLEGWLLPYIKNLLFNFAFMPKITIISKLSVQKYDNCFLLKFSKCDITCFADRFKIILLFTACSVVFSFFILYWNNEVYQWRYKKCILKMLKNLKCHQMTLCWSRW